MSYVYRTYNIGSSIADIVIAFDDIFINELGYTKTDDQVSGSDRLLNYDYDFDNTKTYANCSLRIFLDYTATYCLTEQKLMYNYNPVTHTPEYESDFVVNPRRVYFNDTLEVHIFTEPQFRGFYFINNINSSYYSVVGVFRPLGFSQDYFQDENTKMRLVVFSYNFAQAIFIKGQINPTNDVYSSCFIDTPNMANSQGINFNLIEGVTLWGGLSVSNIQEPLQQFDSNLRFSIRTNVGTQASLDIQVGDIWRSFVNGAAAGFYLKVT